MGGRSFVFEVDPLEGQDRHIPGESEVPGDAVGVKAGRIDEGAVAEDRLPRPDAAVSEIGPVGGPVEELDPPGGEIRRKAFGHRPRIDGRCGRRPERDPAGSGVGLDLG